MASQRELTATDGHVSVVLYRKSLVKFNESAGPVLMCRSLPDLPCWRRLQLLCTWRFKTSKREEKHWLRTQLAGFGRFFVMLSPSRTILMPLLLKMVAAAVALVMFCLGAEAAINPKHGNRVVGLHLQQISLLFIRIALVLLVTRCCRCKSAACSRRRPRPQPMPCSPPSCPPCPSTRSRYRCCFVPAAALHSQLLSPLTPQPPPYARPRDAALAAAAVGTCLEEPLSFAASVIGALKHAFFWSRFR